MKRFILILLCLTICLGIFAGCKGKTRKTAETSEVTDEISADDTTDDSADDTSEDSSEVPEDDNSDHDAYSSSAALNSLRQCMTGTPQLFAAAYIGITDTVEPVDPLSWVNEKAPQLCSNLPFINDILDSDIIGDTYGECYLIVPADSRATVSVNLIDYEGNEGEVLYRSEDASPVLLFCNKDVAVPDTEVHITDSEGRSIVWYPQLDDRAYLYEAYDLDGNLAVMDFSPYSESLRERYEYDKVSFWKLPEKVDLVGTSWEAVEILHDGTECSYSIDIFADTVNIVWNDGIDEENHSFSAPWTLKTEDGICMMEMDLGNLDGIRNFCVLMSTGHNLISFSQDFVNDDIRDYEKLSRVLERTYG